MVYLGAGRQSKNTKKEGILKMLTSGRKVITAIEEITLSPRKLKVGQRLQISASCGFAGIISGCIKVLKICTGQGVPNADLAAYDEMEIITDDGLGCVRHIDEFWVKFRYEGANAENADFWMPLYIFEDHISIY